MNPQISTETGHLFERGYPPPEVADDIHDQQELRRAVAAHRFFYPAVSMEAIFEGNRMVGIEDGKGMLAMVAGPRHVVLTANSDTPYGAGVLDLLASGPMVIDLPAGPYVALVDDHHHRWVMDLGLAGPDAGRGGKYLLLPPGYRGDVPAGYHIARATTSKVLVALRAIPVGGDAPGAFDALCRVRIHPLGDPSAVLPYFDFTDHPIDSTPLRWEDNLEYWKRLHAIVGSEPIIDEFRPMYGELAALGLVRGKPFAPGPRTMRVLEAAAKIGIEEMRVEAFASRRPDRIVWDDRRWEWIGLVPDDPNFETRWMLDIEARDRWFFQAVGASPAMFRRQPGSGSLYFLAAQDTSGAYLDGGTSYRISIPQPVPARMFWSLTAYDSRTRSQVQTVQDKAVLSSLYDPFEPGPDGSVDLYLGPEPPAGKEQQWIRTAPGTGLFLYLRIYGPDPASLDGSWRPSDVTPTAARRTARPARGRGDVPRSITTPATTQSRIGVLRFADGVPGDDTAARVYEHLDFMRGVETFTNAFQAVSLQAMRESFVDVGVKDNDVLLFSGLMDCKSLFLTANCDTVYFFSFINLSRGPMVLQVPANVLGVLDDMWFRWVVDVGLAGPDRGEGGRYLLVPPDHDGPLPESGFHVSRSRSNRILVLGRAFLQDDDPAPAAAAIRAGVRVYPYTPGGVGSSVAAYLDGQGPFARPAAPGETRFVEGTGLEMNTIPPNDLTFYEMLDAAVQAEPAGALDPELAGQFASIGIVKGEPFAPDARMKAILTEAVALGNATSRTIAFRSRDTEGFGYYGAGSAWVNPLFAAGYEFQTPPPVITPEGVEAFPDRCARQLDARTAMFYIATGITPAMCMRMTGIGSQYLAAFHDAKGRAFDGGKTYRVALPPGIPAAAFWSFTLYDNQTRSMLQTPQRFPRAGSQSFPTPAAVAGADGWTTIHIGPERPQDVESGNWIQTVPGKGWFAALRLYGPLQPFFDLSWRPGELEEVKPA